MSENRGFVHDLLVSFDLCKVPSDESVVISWTSETAEVGCLMLVEVTGVVSLNQPDACVKATSCVIGHN